MPPEYLFDYLRCYFTFSFFLLEVHLKVVKACSDNLIRLIIVNEVFSVLKEWLQNLPKFECKDFEVIEMEKQRVEREK